MNYTDMLEKSSFASAHEFNSAGEGDDDSPSSEDLWEAYDEGVAAAIHADIATYTDDDYGIPPPFEGPVTRRTKH